MNGNKYKYREDDTEIYHNISCIIALEQVVKIHNKCIAAVTHLNNGKFKGDDLANLWGIGLKAAQKTLKATTQLSTRHLSGKIHRRVRTKMHQRRYRQLWGHLSRFASVAFMSKVKSLGGNNYFQLFCNNGAFTKVYPM